MESIIINLHSIIDFHSKFCLVKRGISNNIEITLSCQLEKVGAFSKCHVKQSNNILQAFLELSSLYARNFTCPKD